MTISQSLKLSNLSVKSNFDKILSLLSFFNVPLIISLSKSPTTNVFALSNLIWSLSKTLTLKSGTLY